MHHKEEWVSQANNECDSAFFLADQRLIGPLPHPPQPFLAVGADDALKGHEDLPPSSSSTGTIPRKEQEHPPLSFLMPYRPRPGRPHGGEDPPAPSQLRLSDPEANGIKSIPSRTSGFGYTFEGRTDAQEGEGEVEGGEWVGWSVLSGRSGSRWNWGDLRCNWPFSDCENEVFGSYRVV